MQRSPRRAAALLLMGCLLGFGWASVRAADTSHWLVSKDLLDHAELTVLWQTTLPVKEGESLDTMLLVDDRLYVRSNRNYTWSLNRNDGDVIFSRSIARPGFPLLGWVGYENRLLSVIDNQLVEFDRDTGLERRVSDLELSIVAPPARNSRYLYLSAADGRLHAFRAKDMVEIFKVAAENESLITTVLADEETVVFGTDTGNLIAMMADAPRKLWQFNAVEAIAGPVAWDGTSFYFASKDTNVYRVGAADTVAVTLLWKHQTEAVLDRAPRLTADVVYQYAPGRGLTAVDKQSGQALWTLPEGLDLLAEATGRAYVITKFRTLTVMDNTTGKELYRVNFAPVVNHAANLSDAKIYVADGRGRVACLGPIQ